MEFTADQLKAIENAVGRNAKVRVILPPSYGYAKAYHEETILEVTADHDGRRVVSQVIIRPYFMTDLPFRVLAEKLVMDINHYIMREAFSGVFPR